MKTCPRCGLSKDKSEFSKSWCKQCHSDSRMVGYWKNRESELLYKKTRRENLRLENTLLIREYLSTHPCIDCGEADPIVLEFDHVIGEKKFAISSKVADYKWDRIWDEIQKCEVRCANCHRRKTAKDFNWYSYI